MRFSDLYGNSGMNNQATPTSQEDTNPTQNPLDKTKANDAVKGKATNVYGTIALLALFGILVGLKFGLENNN